MNWVSSETTFQIPTGVFMQVWCILTPISAVIYLTMSKVTQKWEWGKRVPPVPGHFRRRPSLSSSHTWLKHDSHMMQITEPPQAQRHELRCFKFYLGKLFCSDTSYARSDSEDITIPQSAFFPIRCHPWFGCPPAGKAAPWARPKNWLWFQLQPSRSFPKPWLLSLCPSSALSMRLD